MDVSVIKRPQIECGDARWTPIELEEMVLVPAGE